jgi:hypothetical protein
MPIRIDWDNAEQTILYVRYEAPWTWGDFYDAAKECAVLASTVSHQVFVIAEMVGGFMPQGAPFVHGEKVMKHATNAHMGFVVVVADNRFIQSLVSVSSRIIPGWREKYRTANTIAEARALIEQEQQKIVVST